MAITVNIYYTGNRGAARKFAEEMTVSGVVDASPAEAGTCGMPISSPWRTRRLCC